MEDYNTPEGCSQRGGQVMDGQPIKDKDYWGLREEISSLTAELTAARQAATFWSKCHEDVSAELAAARENALARFEVGYGACRRELVLPLQADLAAAREELTRGFASELENATLLQRAEAAEKERDEFRAVAEGLWPPARVDKVLLENDELRSELAAAREEIKRAWGQLAKSCGDEWDDRFDCGTPCSRAWDIHRELEQRAEAAEAEVARMQAVVDAARVLRLDADLVKAKPKFFAILAALEEDTP